MRRQEADAEPSAASAWLLRLVGGLLMLTALAVSLSRAPDRPVESLVARWAPPPSDFVELDGLAVHVRDEGPRDGPLPPLLLLHDVGGSLHDWEGWAAALKRERRVVSVDLPGAGLTGPSTDHDESPAALAGFAQRLMDTLQLPAADVVGHGRGAEVAWRLAAQAPSRVDRLLLINPTGPGWRPVAVPALWRVMTTPVAHAVAGWLLPRELVASTLATLSGDAAKVDAQQVDRMFELLLRDGNREALHRQLSAIAAQAASGAVLPPPGRPTVIAWGERDGWLPASLGERLAQQASARLVRLPGLGHRPQVEDPAASLAALRPYLQP